MNRERYLYFTTEEMLCIPAEEISDIRQLAEAPLVSVVVMTRNHQEYIVQAVESIVAQEIDFHPGSASLGSSGSLGCGNDHVS